MQQQPPALTPQQEAIRQVRERYETGDLPFDRFEYALNALLQAQTPEECEAIVRELPSSPVSALDVLVPQPVAPPAPSAPRRTRWWVAFMGGVRRMSRPWRLVEQTIAIAVMGGIDVDLSLAELPPQGVIRLFALMGGAQIYVPRSVDVSVRSFVMLGGVDALGEGNGGIISFSHEESRGLGNAGTALHQIEIQVFALMGGAQVVQMDAPVIAGGKPVVSNSAMLSASFDRHALHDLHRAERQARRELRRQQRHAHD
jgi:hypothetical protein